VIYLGTIANAGSDVKNNLNTAAPFAIPSWVTQLRLQPSAATQMAVMSYANDSAFAPAATAMLQLGGALSVNDISCGRPSAPVVAPTLAVRKTDAGAGTCAVFAMSWADVDS
jgi:hypothetical protein